MKTQNAWVMPVIIAGVCGLVGFFGGMQYQKNQVQQFGAMRNGIGGTGREGNSQTQRMGFRPVSGEILSVDETTMTVKQPDGSSKIVILSASTEINKAASASAADLKTGETVMVFGKSNTDGSVAAQNIQLNPIMRNGRDGQPAGK